MDLAKVLLIAKTCVERVILLRITKTLYSTKMATLLSSHFVLLARRLTLQKCLDAFSSIIDHHLFRLGNQRRHILIFE